MSMSIISPELILGLDLGLLAHRVDLPADLPVVSLDTRRRTGHQEVLPAGTYDIVKLSYHSGVVRFCGSHV